MSYKTFFLSAAMAALLTSPANARAAADAGMPLSVITRDDVERLCFSSITESLKTVTALPEIGCGTRVAHD